MSEKNTENARTETPLDALKRLVAELSAAEEKSNALGNNENITFEKLKAERSVTEAKLNLLNAERLLSNDDRETLRKEITAKGEAAGTSADNIEIEINKTPGARGMTEIREAFISLRVDAEAVQRGLLNQEKLLFAKVTDKEGIPRAERTRFGTPTTMDEYAHYVETVNNGSRQIEGAADWLEGRLARQAEEERERAEARRELRARLIKGEIQERTAAKQSAEIISPASSSSSTSVSPLSDSSPASSPPGTVSSSPANSTKSMAQLPPVPAVPTQPLQPISTLPPPPVAPHATAARSTMEEKKQLLLQLIDMRETQYFPNDKAKEPKKLDALNTICKAMGMTREDLAVCKDGDEIDAALKRVHDSAKPPKEPSRFRQVLGKISGSSDIASQDLCRAINDSGSDVKKMSAALNTFNNQYQKKGAAPAPAQIQAST